MLMAYVEAVHVLKTDVERSLPIMKKYMRITDEVIAKRSYDIIPSVFQPPLTEEKASAWCLNSGDATRLRECQNARAEDFGVTVYCWSCSARLFCALQTRSSHETLRREYQNFNSTAIR
jgi:NAD-dependent DNA ligase